MGEININRTPITPHLAAEIAKLSQVPAETTGTAVGPIPVTAEAQRAPQVGIAEVETVQKELVSALGAFPLDMPGLVRRQAFEEFRKEVIAAFKHLGLDVRKHFHEGIT